MRMITAGVDIGSLTGKAVILEDESIRSYYIMHVKKRPEVTAAEVMDKVLEGASISMDEVEFCVGTGYGRRKVPIADKMVSEISCHGKGAHWLSHSIRTIIDIGGQDCKVIKVDDRGVLINFVMNDKCAAGTGRYLEIMAETLELSLEELSKVSLRATSSVEITSICSVYAQSEAAQFLAEGAKKANIAEGVNRAMAVRVASLARRIGIKEDVTVTGGVAKNRGVVNHLEKILGIKTVELPVDPQIVGALGAALMAGDSATSI